MNKNSQQEKSTVGLLLIIGDIISNEQRDEICVYLEQAFKQIDNNKYREINDLFDNLIHANEFQPGLFELFFIHLKNLISNRLPISTNG
jgi:hypothetical protein